MKNAAAETEGAGGTEAWRSASLSAPTSDCTTGTRLVSCGGTLDGVGVDILDTDGSPLPKGAFGEIAVCEEALATGYLGRGLTAFDGRHRTGDMGFTRDGELYVIGRAGDGIKVNGRWLFAEDVQDLTADASPKLQRTVALLGTMSGATLRSWSRTTAPRRRPRRSGASWRRRSRGHGCSRCWCHAAAYGAPRAASPRAGQCGGSW
ncbi:hypothetical protein ACFXKC_42315 [Streptomyces sp. NPDC059340]|uniref:hypothetical protein n=1 Tax=Streptomyces sp. NPDC059340 TaxID=3346806 RepID=UPI0036CA70DE